MTMRKLITNDGYKVHWCILGAPSWLTGKNFGEAKSVDEAETVMDRLLNGTSTTNSRRLALS